MPDKPMSWGKREIVYKELVNRFEISESDARYLMESDSLAPIVKNVVSNLTMADVIMDASRVKMNDARAELAKATGAVKKLLHEVVRRQI